MQNNLEHTAKANRDDRPALVIVLDDRETCGSLGGQTLLTIGPTGAVKAYDLARFLREHITLLRAPEYQMPVGDAIKFNALTDIAEGLDLEVGAHLWMPPVERVTPPSQSLKL